MVSFTQDYLYYCHWLCVWRLHSCNLSTQSTHALGSTSRRGSYSKSHMYDAITTIWTLCFLQVVSWIVYGGLFSYVKVSIAGLCRQKSERALFWCGAFTQVGSAFGALLMFLLVNVASNVFFAYYVEC